MNLPVITLLKALAGMPMRRHHRVGAAIGWLMYWFFPSYTRRVKNNVSGSGLCSTAAEIRALVKEVSLQDGKAATEWAIAWFVPHATIDRLCSDCTGWREVEQARQRGKGIIFLVPHLGSFPVAVRYLAGRLPLTALYHTPKFKQVDSIMMAGSQYSGFSMAPTNMKGVEKLLQALRRGEAIVLPPDQAPSSAGGVWADFFGRPAYTMTLARKMQRATGAAIIAAFAERLPDGGGFRLECRAVPSENFDEAALNRVVEDLVRRCPTQFMWSYKRYKIPRAAMKRARRK